MVLRFLECYMDGGTVNNTPISHAAALGADVVWVLPAGYSCALQAAPASALGMAPHGLAVLIHQRLAADCARYRSDHHVITHTACQGAGCG